jgi:hypothetical protein
VSSLYIIYFVVKSTIDLNLALSLTLALALASSSSLLLGSSRLGHGSLDHLGDLGNVFVSNFC